MFLDLGEMEIWDGADLSLLRDTLTQLIERQKCRSLGVNMHFVKYIPSGFFGMLYDWYEKRGVQFFLTTPQPNVQRMLWFRQFFQKIGSDRFLLVPEPLRPAEIPMNPLWQNPAEVDRSAKAFALVDEV